MLLISSLVILLACLQILLVHGYSRVVVQALLYAAVNQKKRIQVYVTESRPVRLRSTSPKARRTDYISSIVWTRTQDTRASHCCVYRMHSDTRFCCIVRDGKSGSGGRWCGGSLREWRAHKFRRSRGDLTGLFIVLTMFGSQRLVAINSPSLRRLVANHYTVSHAFVERPLEYHRSILILFWFF